MILYLPESFVRAFNKGNIKIKLKDKVILTLMFLGFISLISYGFYNTIIYEYFELLVENTLDWSVLIVTVIITALSNCIIMRNIELKNDLNINENKIKIRLKIFLGIIASVFWIIKYNFI